MDRAARAPARDLLTGAARDGAQLRRRIERAVAASEAAQRGPTALALGTLGAALLAAGPLLPHARFAFGGVTPFEAFATVGAAWLVFVAATLAFHATPAHGPLFRALDTLDESTRYGAIAVLVALSGGATTPLWLAVLAKALTWRPTTPERTRRTQVVLVVVVGALAAFFFATGHPADAIMTVVLLSAALAGHFVTARLAADALRVGAERDLLQEELDVATLERARDRIARELHDGVGADVMALVLRLRRLALSDDTPATARRAERAARILGELRAIVWTLRQGHGTLAELEKLLVARMREVSGSLRVEGATTPEEARRAVPSGVALAALAVASPLVRALVETAEARVVTVALSLGTSLALSIGYEGAALEAARLDAMDGPFAEARRVLDARAGTLVFRANAGGGELHATLPIDDAGSAV